VDEQGRPLGIPDDVRVRAGVGGEGHRRAVPRDAEAHALQAVVDPEGRYLGVGRLDGFAGDDLAPAQAFA